MYVLKQLLDLDWGRIIDDLESFVKNYVEGSRASGAVIGLSGGVEEAPYQLSEPVYTAVGKAVEVIIPIIDKLKRIGRCSEQG